MAIYGSDAWGDYDNDGDLDLLITGFDQETSSPISRVYRNEAGSFSLAVELTGVAYSDAAWGDYDDDGYLDIVLAGDTDSGSGYIARVYHNNGNGTFSTAASLTGATHAAVAWGDYDNDGRLDILLTGDTWSGYAALVYRNNGDGTFSDARRGSGGRGLRRCRLGRLRQRRDLDILLAGTMLWPACHQAISQR